MRLRTMKESEREDCSMAPKAIIVSLENTLYDQKKAYQESLEIVIDSFFGRYSEGEHTPEQLMKSFIAASRKWNRKRRKEKLKLLDTRVHILKEVLEPLGIAVTNEFAQTVYGQFEKIQWTRIRPFPEMIETLKEISHRVPIGLVADGEIESVQQRLLLLGLDQLIPLRNIVVSDKNQGRLVRSAQIRRLLKIMELPAAQALFVGHSLTRDVRSARAAGLEVIWFNPAGGPIRSKGLRSIKQIKKWSDLLAFTR